MTIFPSGQSSLSYPNLKHWDIICLRGLFSHGHNLIHFSMVTDVNIWLVTFGFHLHNAIPGFPIPKFDLTQPSLEMKKSQLWDDLPVCSIPPPSYLPPPLHPPLSLPPSLPLIYSISPISYYLPLSGVNLPSISTVLSRRLILVYYNLPV